MPIKVWHNRQGQLSIFHFRISFLNPLKVTILLTVSGTEFQTIGPTYLKEFLPNVLGFLVLLKEYQDYIEISNYMSYFYYERYHRNYFLTNYNELYTFQLLQFGYFGEKLRKTHLLLITYLCLWDLSFAYNSSKLETIINNRYN